jgi:hypothetical protein
MSGKKNEGEACPLPSLTIILPISHNHSSLCAVPAHCTVFRVVFTSLKIRRIVQPRRVCPYTAEQSASSQVLQDNARGKHLSPKSSRLTPEANKQDLQANARGK